MNLIPRPVVMALFGVTQNTLSAWHEEGILKNEKQAKPRDPIFYDPAALQAALDKATRVGAFTLRVEDLLERRQGLHSTADAALILKVNRPVINYAINNKLPWVKALQLQKRWFILDSCIRARAQKLGQR